MFSIITNQSTCNEILGQINTISLTLLLSSTISIL